MLVQRKRTKRKDSQSLVPLAAECPALLIKSRRLGMSYPYGVLGRVVILLFAALLGCVKWHKKQKLFIFLNPFFHAGLDIIK